MNYRSSTVFSCVNMRCAEPLAEYPLSNSDSSAYGSSADPTCVNITCKTSDARIPLPDESRLSELAEGSYNLVTSVSRVMIEQVCLAVVTGLVSRV